MTKEELNDQANALLTERELLKERLNHIENLSADEKAELYTSFRRNFNVILQIEKALDKMEIDEALAFLKELLG